MKKYLFTAFFILTAAFFAFINNFSVFAMGDMGFFGGISDGRKLPRTSELLLAQTARSNQRNQKQTHNYTELVFIDGRPIEFNGLIDITINGGVTASMGNFTVNYRIYPFNSRAAAEDGISINRTANFRVTYRTEGGQVIYNYDIVKSNWRDVIVIGDTSYMLDSRRSHYGISIIEDRTPGVKYYRGDLSSQLYYTYGTNTEVNIETVGAFYGCHNAWSSTETHRMDVSVVRDGWALAYQIRPSVTVNKVLQYVQNEPTAISFSGNYREVMQNNSGLRYDLIHVPQFMWDEPIAGNVNLQSVNIFEQLPAADLSFLAGNSAEDDIAKLFAMQILGGVPSDYQPSQLLTRGQFVTMLAKAIKLPVEQPAATRTAAQVAYIFSDVNSTRPEYPFILAAFKSGMASGRDNGMFYFDYPIERQEAFVMIIKALGLSNLSPNPTPHTPFADDAQIASWAKRETSVALSIGLIAPDEFGHIYPSRHISKGEAATLINHVIEYLRAGLV
ncbi:MAG: S-layer homology domain-containing protein, partial [Defluviitaleaceae bacterium]|nr:S-layer homology domain-containing protein [Defluviitaleaceae bacterium]